MSAVAWLVERVPGVSTADAVMHVRMQLRFGLLTCLDLTWDWSPRLALVVPQTSRHGLVSASCVASGADPLGRGSVLPGARLWPLLPASTHDIGARSICPCPSRGTCISSIVANRAHCAPASSHLLREVHPLWASAYSKICCL